MIVYLLIYPFITHPHAEQGSSIIYYVIHPTNIDDSQKTYLCLLVATPGKFCISYYDSISWWKWPITLRNYSESKHPESRPISHPLICHLCYFNRLALFYPQMPIQQRKSRNGMISCLALSMSLVNRHFIFYLGGHRDTELKGSEKRVCHQNDPFIDSRNPWGKAPAATAICLYLPEMRLHYFPCSFFVHHYHVSRFLTD